MLAEEVEVVVASSKVLLAHTNVGDEDNGDDDHLNMYQVENVKQLQKHCHYIR